MSGIKAEDTFFVHIGIKILANHNLSAKEMILCGAIEGLSNKISGCFEKNGAIADLLHCSETSVANIISRLYKEGAIKNIGKMKSRELVLNDDFFGGDKDGI